MENAAFVVKNRHLIEYIGNNEYIEIPEAVTVIDDFAFEGNKKIEELYEDSRFNNCV